MWLDPTGNGLSSQNLSSFALLVRTTLGQAAGLSLQSKSRLPYLQMTGSALR